MAIQATIEEKRREEKVKYYDANSTQIVPYLSSGRMHAPTKPEANESALECLQ